MELMFSSYSFSYKKQNEGDFQHSVVVIAIGIKTGVIETIKHLQISHSYLYYIYII
jgi:hypothetical protein